MVNYKKGYLHVKNAVKPKIHVKNIEFIKENDFCKFKIAEINEDKNEYSEDIFKSLKNLCENEKKFNLIVFSEDKTFSKKYNDCLLEKTSEISQNLNDLRLNGKFNLR
ncbi:MAG: hypothetical protein KO202_01155 [Methanobacteriaceae archaeon]|jgi:hypothetical protein|nr:hypothetical protein [Methanobacteriaceae archaeon]